MLQFICLGSGSSGNCYYLYTENGGIVIDLGIGIRSFKKYFRDYGLSMAKVKAIFITHEHADHIKAVGAVSNELGVPVYATELVHHGIVKNYCVTTKVKKENIKVFTVGENIDICDFHLTTFTVPHDSSDNVGYSINHEDKNFCLITDAGCVTDEMCSFIRKADYLVLEANYEMDLLEAGPYPRYLKERIMSGRGHLCNTETARTLVEHTSEKLKHVWLCHLSEENNHPELARKNISAELFSKKEDINKDLILDVLRRKTPSGIYNL